MVLDLPNLQRPFKLECDASSHAMGAVLFQDGRPVAYHSEIFQDAQRNYPTDDNELYALHQAVKLETLPLGQGDGVAHRP